MAHIGTLRGKLIFVALALLCTIMAGLAINDIAPAFAWADEATQANQNTALTTEATTGANTTPTQAGKWVKSSGKWYYQNANGSWAKGWIQPDGKTWYFLNKSGVMQTGWLNRGKTWYYLNKSGAMATGWKKVSGKWYYLDTESGAMKTGWIRPDGKTWYFLNSSGAMQTGWLKRGKTWYYLTSSGAMATGWQKVKGTWYYLDPTSGAMASNTVVEGYYLQASGAMVGKGHVAKIEKTATAEKTDTIVLVVGHQLTLYKKQSDGSWVNYLDVYCGYGSKGMAYYENKHEGDYTTPIGSFTIPYAFGNAKDPGSGMKYWRTTANSYWSAERKTYNTWVESSTPIRGEHLSSIYQYKYAAVIGYNMNPTHYGKGSAFFLHCKSTNTWDTAGCVSVTEANMKRILALLKDGAYIVIVPKASDIEKY